MLKQQFTGERLTLAAYCELIMPALVLAASGELTPSVGSVDVGGARGGAFFSGWTFRIMSKGEMPRGRGAIEEKLILPYSKMRLRQASSLQHSEATAGQFSLVIRTM